MQFGWLRTPLACSGLFLVILCTRDVRADTLREAVREHVEQSVEEREGEGEAQEERPRSPKKKKKPRRKKRVPQIREPNAGSEGSAGSTRLSVRVGGAPEPRGAPPVDPYAGLPRRLLGSKLQLDLKLGGGYRGWVPMQFDTVDVKMASAGTWSVSLKARILKFLVIRRAYYESNSVSASKIRGVELAVSIASYQPKFLWLLGVLGLPISRHWEPTLRYESRAFNTRALPREPICLVPRDAVDLELSPELADADNGCPRVQRELEVVSSMQTMVAGVRYNASRIAKQRARERGQTSLRGVPDLLVGLGLLEYTKPYQLSDQGEELGRALFDGRFRGAGLALGSYLKGGPGRFSAQFDAQLGLGEVSLTDSLTLNEFLRAEGWLLGYAQGRLSGDYRYVLLAGPPTILLVPRGSLAGVTFFPVDTRGESDTQVQTSSYNWDLLWSAGLSISIAL